MSIHNLYRGRPSREVKEMISENEVKFRKILLPIRVPYDRARQELLHEALFRVRVSLFKQKSAQDRREAVKKGAWWNFQQALCVYSPEKTAKLLGISQLELCMLGYGLFPEDITEEFVDKLEEVLANQW